MAASLEVTGWRKELEALLARFGRLFVRAEPRAQAGRGLGGLLGSVRRKNGWQLAEHLGSATPGRGAPSGCSATCSGTRRPHETCAAPTRTARA